jgi:hypothetical protein
MKKIMMIAAMMVAAISANAQNEVGQLTLMPKAGINISTITGSGSDKKSKVGLVAGAEFEYGVAQNFDITAGVLYSMEGAKIGDAKFNMDYINIPILANYYVVPGLAVKAGIQPAFNVRKKASYNGNTVNIDDVMNAVLDWTGAGVETGVKTFNLSIPVGLSYEYQSFVLDARYNIGVTKLFKNADQGRNSTFAITLGYKFAL